MARHQGPIAVPKNIEPWLYNALNRLNSITGQSSSGLAAIVRGEVPDGSGNPITPNIDLSEYFYLPGRGGGQTAYFDTVASGSGILSSTASSTKGKIYLGTALSTAYNETTDNFGVGTGSPTARMHVHLATPGTTTIGAIGNTFFKASTVISSVDTDLTVWSAYQNNGGAYDLAILSGGLAASRGIIFTDFNLLSGLRFAQGTYGVGTISYAHMQAGVLNSLGQSRNNNLLLVGMNDNIGTTLWTNFQRVSFRTDLGSGELGTGVIANNTMIAVNLDADQYATSAAANQTSLLVGPKASGSVPVVVEQASTTINAFEVRKASGGVSPAKTLGSLKMAITPGIGALTSESSLVGYISGVEAFRLAPIASATDQWAFQTPLGAVQFAHASTTGLWADSLAAVSHRFELGTSNSSTRIAGITSEAGNILDRLGITAHGVSIENTTLGGGAAGISAPGGLLQVRNRGAVGVIPVLIRGVASQTGDLLRITDSGSVSRFQFQAPTTSSDLRITMPSGGKSRIFMTPGASAEQAYIDFGQTTDFGPPLGTSSGVPPAGTRFNTYWDASNPQFCDAYGQDAASCWVLVDVASDYMLVTGDTTSASRSRAVWNPNGDLINYGRIRSSKFTVGTTGLTAGVPGIELEETGSGTQYIALRAPSAVAANRTQLLFDMNGTVPLVGDDPPAVASRALGKVDDLTQGASGTGIASTNLTNSGLTGMYLVQYYLETVTADGTAGTITFQINHTDDIGATTQVSAALALTATTVRISGTFQAYLASGELSYQTNIASGAINSGRYTLRVRVMYLG